MGFLGTLVSRIPIFFIGVGLILITGGYRGAQGDFGTLPIAGGALAGFGVLLFVGFTVAGIGD